MHSYSLVCKLCLPRVHAECRCAVCKAREFRVQYSWDALSFLKHFGVVWNTDCIVSCAKPTAAVSCAMCAADVSCAKRCSVVCKAEWDSVQNRIGMCAILHASVSHAQCIRSWAFRTVVVSTAEYAGSVCKPDNVSFIEQASYWEQYAYKTIVYWSSSSNGIPNAIQTVKYALCMVGDIYLHARCE